jgi:hypothetical protein
VLDTGVLSHLQSAWFEHYRARLDLVSDTSTSLDCNGRDNNPSDVHNRDTHQGSESPFGPGSSFHCTRMGSIVAGKGLPSQNFSG